MNVIRACCLRHLKENKKRTIVTIVGVALATGLITATACMLMSFYVSFLEDLKQSFGDNHVLYWNVKGENLKYFEQNQNFESLGYSCVVGSADLPTIKGEDGVSLRLRAADVTWYRGKGVRLTAGRMPEKDNEIIVGRDIRTKLGIDCKVGDQINLQIGQRMAGDSEDGEASQVDEEKTYKIVGFFQGGYSLKNIEAYTYLDLSKVEEEQSYDILARYTKWGMKHHEQVNAGLSEVSGGSIVNNVILKMEGLDLRDESIWAMAAVFLVLFLLILLVGVLSIVNSFGISLTEKIRFYGMMASVGTTKRQRRQLVWLEAFYVGGAGIAGGLFLGVFFTHGLVKIVNAVISRQLGYSLIFKISWPALLVAVFFSALMVFLSAVESADRAAKISPIEAIRSNDTVKNPGKPRKTPSYVKKIFGIGGCIAYQNFQRAKVKYRTIVITIVVSVSVFVGMSALRYGYDGMEKSMRYEAFKYQLKVTTFTEDELEVLKSLADLPGVAQAEITWDHLVTVDAGGVSRPSGDGGPAPFQDQDFNAHIEIMEEESFQAYCRQVGVSYEEARDKAIVNAQETSVTKEIGKVILNIMDLAEFQAGDVVSGVSTEANWPFSVEVACQTEELPLSHNMPLGGVVFFVSESWARQQPDFAEDFGRAALYIRCEDSFAVEDAIMDSAPLGCDISNFGAEYQTLKNDLLISAIFLAGFVGVFILIGITNIFNALTTNMELRAPEFARLRATGMTGKEFRNMIWVEGLFYGGKALLIGLPVGIMLSYGLYWTLLPSLNDLTIPFEYRLPVPEVLISVVAIAILLYGIMRYCMKKIGRRNVIETIRNENI